MCNWLCLTGACCRPAVGLTLVRILLYLTKLSWPPGTSWRPLTVTSRQDSESLSTSWLHSKHYRVEWMFSLPPTVWPLHHLLLLLPPASCLLPPALQCTNTSSFYSPPSSSPVTLLNIHSFSLYLFYLLYIFDVKILMLQILEFKGF